MARGVILVNTPDFDSGDLQVRVLPGQLKLSN